MPRKSHKCPKPFKSPTKCTVTTPKKKKRNPRCKETFAPYIYKVLKQTNPDLGISTKAMNVMDNFVTDVFQRIATEASRLAHYNNRSGITCRDIQAAVWLVLPGDLAACAVCQGTKVISP